jgi:hypothetical protein
MADGGMKKTVLKKIILAAAFHALCISMGMLTLNTGCKPLPTDNTTWPGDEQVYVTFGAQTETISLHGMASSKYDGIECVKLSDIVKKAGLATSAELEDYYFNFIAVDGYDMSKRAIEWRKSLPTWDDMQKGYLYDSGSSGGLTAMWEDGTPEAAFNGGRFYNVRLMDGGIIQILEDNVL